MWKDLTEKSDSNDWWTKPELYKSLCEKYNVKPLLDAAATAESTKCQYFLGDALNQEWTIGDRARITVDTWLNPPLGKSMTKKFLSRALDQWMEYGMNILAIVPAGVISRAYFQPIWRIFKDSRRIDIEPIIPRPSFLYKGKPSEFTARNDYIAILFKKRG